MTTFLVTGAAGFIGSSIARALLANGHRVRGFDNFSTGKHSNISDLPGLDLVEGDVREAAKLKGACKGIDCIYHEAAIASVPRSVEDPVESHDVNATGTLNVLLAARDAQVKRVIYAGSSAAYGDAPTLPAREDSPSNTISPYAASKLAGEHYMTAFARCYRMETIILRYFNVFGPRQDPTSMYSGVIAIFISAMLSRRRPTIFGDGEQSRDFTFIEDVVRANLMAAEASAEKVAARVLNVATGKSASLNDIYRALQKVTGFDESPLYGPERGGDIKHSVADISNARLALGFEPTIDLEEGLRRTVDWYRENSSAASSAR